MILDFGTLGTLLGELLERFGWSSSHQNDDDDDDEHDNAQENDQDDGHADAPRLLPLSIHLSQNTLTLLCVHEVALHGADVGGDHTSVRCWEDALLQTLSLVDSDGDDRTGCSTLILTVHCEWDAVGGVNAVDLTLFSSNTSPSESLRQRHTLIQVPSRDDVSVGGSAI